MSFRHTFLFNPDFPKVTPHIDEWCETCKVFQPNGRESELIHCLGCHQNKHAHDFPVLKFLNSYDAKGNELVVKSRRCSGCFREKLAGIDYKVLNEPTPKRKTILPGVNVFKLGV